MSEVESVNGGEAPGQGAEEKSAQTTEVPVIVGNAKMVAPALRVEELRDDGNSSATYSVSEGELSHDASSDKDEPSPFVPPDDELKQNIIQQVEFYFSDANILKDAFLLKHVRRNKQGYVSLKLVTSFKKMKSLTKDFRVVAYSLRLSDKLEVNEEGTKVRRINPLPDYDETTPSRTVVAVNLPMENPTFENVAEIFSWCGEISLIRILRPGKTIPPDVKKHINKHPEIGNTVCALIEFENHEAAKKACESMTNQDDWRSGMRVVLLAVKKDKEKKDKANDKDKGNKSEKDAALSDEKETDGKSEQKRKKKRGGKRKNSRVEELKDGESPCYSSGSEAEMNELSPPHIRPRSASSPYLGLRSPRNSLSPKPDSSWLSPNSTPGSSPKGSPRGSPTSRRRNMTKRSPLATDKMSPGTSPRHSPPASPDMSRRRDSEGPSSSPSSPWVQRRLKAQQEKSPLTTGSSPGTSPLLGRRIMANMHGVIRQPVGPDGTKGFTLGRGKPRAEAVA